MRAGPVHGLCDDDDDKDEDFLPGYRLPNTRRERAVETSPPRPVLLARRYLSLPAPEDHGARFPVAPTLARRIESDWPLVAAAPDPQLTICVVVPVRDEALGLDATLESVARQQGGSALDIGPLAACGLIPPACVELIVLANNCSDASAEVARAYGERHPWLRLHVVERTLLPPHAHVGHARQLLMDEAYRRLCAVGRPRGIIASTDGDTRVTEGWLAAIAREVAAGSDAVYGRIVVDRADLLAMETHTRAIYLRDASYRLLAADLEGRLDPVAADPSPRHHQHFGASLAVTAGIYAAAGGLPPVSPLEDMAFFRALTRIDARVRHSPVVRVVTSGRRSVRVVVGLSTQLGEWTHMGRTGQPHLVISAAALATRFRACRLLRGLWAAACEGEPANAGLIDRVADDLCVERGFLTGVIYSAPTFGVLWDDIGGYECADGSGAWIERWPLEEIGQAIHHLRCAAASPGREAVPG